MVTIGRSERADHFFPRDGYMSGEHFALESSGDACFVEDLRSSNGTLVNGRKITAKTPLKGGETVQAGQTRFTVRIEPDWQDSSIGFPKPMPPPPAPRFELDSSYSAPYSTPVLPSQPEPAGQGWDADSGYKPGPVVPRKVPYSVEKCESGILLCRGSIDDLPPAQLGVRLANVFSVCLIVDFKHLGSPPPPDLAQPEYLFNWLDPAAASGVSPVVVHQGDLLTWPALIEGGWGNDAVICLFSHRGRADLLEHLRSSCRVKGRSADRAVLGYCWPSVLAPLLAQSSSMAEQLLTGIEAVLVEFPDLPDTWQLFGAAALPGHLDQLGLTRLPDANQDPRPKN
jgi:hypothetical protein